MFGAGLKARFSALFLARLLTALIQAGALYWLSDAGTAPRSWPATEPHLFLPLVLVATFVPVLALLGLGQIRMRPLAVWLAAAGAVTAGLGYHAASRREILTGALDGGIWSWIDLWLALAVGLFIAHTLVVDAVIEGRLVPSYPRHFDTAWKQGVQINLVLSFLGVFWGVLYLGSALFKLIDIDYFRQLITHRWFAYPATALALAVSIHVTDVQPVLIRGTRSLALVLFSWLLPLLTLIVCGFLACLPFISLAPLWHTHFAARLLLTAAGLLVFLINCCYQDGAAERTGSKIQRIAATVGSITLVPLLVLAIWALSLRVEQYGWSTDRVVAAAIIVIASCYAVGYSTATVAVPSWLKRLEITNFATAYVVLGVLLALFTPIADPARLMVADQVARLKSGAITADKFDFTALRFDGAKWGKAALTELSHDTDIANAASINQKAQYALTMVTRWAPNQPVAAVDIVEDVTVYPAGRSLPSSFLDRTAGPLAGASHPNCLHNGNQKCIARFLSLHPGEPEVLLFLDLYSGRIFEQDQSGKWVDTAQITGVLGCPAIRQAIVTGDFQLEEHARPDIVIGDQHLTMTPPSKPCPPLKK